VQLHVDLGEDVTLVDALFSDISQSSSLHYVPDDELADGFVLWHTSRTVSTPEELYMSTALLVPPSVPPLLSHDGSSNLIV